MSWAEYHTKSEQYAYMAEAFDRKQESERAVEYYRLAAEQETLALEATDRSKKRTYGITAVSAAALWYKARDFQRAQRVAYTTLGNDALPAFAAEELEELLQYIRNEESTRKAGIKFTEGEVLVSVKGKDIVIGGAPLELIHRKVDEISKLFYRTIEFLLKQPHRKKGTPSIHIQEQFRPWLFQAPSGSYQFAVRVERPKQMSLFQEASPLVDEITRTCLRIIKASIDDPHGTLEQLVSDPEYRDTFLKLTRNLAPSDKSPFGQLEIKSATDRTSHPIVITPAARGEINKALQITNAKQGIEEVTLRGTLRALHLDKDWLEIDLDDEDQGSKHIRVSDTGDAIDDVVGPMVNRRVIVNVVRKTKSKYAFRDIQTEE